MADIAKLGFDVNTAPLDQTKVKLNEIIPVAKNVEVAADRVSDKLDEVGVSASAAAAGVSKAATATQAAASGVTATGKAVGDLSIKYSFNANSAVQAATGANVASSAMRAATGAANAEAVAIDNVNASLGRFDSHVLLFQKQQEKMGASMKFTAREGLNFSRQFADIGVTAAMGMNPFMIALQQGPQMFDILQEKAIATNSTLKKVFAELGVVIWTALAPVLPIILAIAAAVGLVAAGFGLMFRQLSKGLPDDVTEGMNLTEEQLDRVTDKTVHFGDVFAATFQVLGEKIMNSPIGDGLRWLGDLFNDVMDWITKAAFNTVAGIIAYYVGGYRTIRDTWKQLPAVFADLGISAANGVIIGINLMVRKGIEGVNLLIDVLNNIPGVKLPTLPDAQISLLQNRFAGAGAAVGQAYVTNMVQAFDEAKAAMIALGDEIGAKALENARARVLEQAGKANKAAAGAKDPADTISVAPLIETIPETFGTATKLIEDFMKKGLEEIAKYNAKVKTFYDGIHENIQALKDEQSYIGLSADETIRLRNENELLAEARRANINLTDEEVEKIKAYALFQSDLEIAIRNTADRINFQREATRGFINDLKSGLQQGKSLWEAFGNAVINVLNKIADRLMDKALDALFSGGTKGGGGFLSDALSFGASLFGGGKTGAGGGKVLMAAKGTVLNGPTVLAHSQGKTTIGGEAGPEGVLPLKRGPGGSLGVQAYDNGSSGPQRVEVAVTAVPSDMLWIEVDARAQTKAVAVTQAGIQQYDNQMPERVTQIANDGRVR